MRNTRRRNSLPTGHAEPLEQRRLLTGEVVGKTLLVTGTDGDDEIVITREDNRYVVTENGGDPQFFGPLGPLGLTRVEVNSLDGDDDINTRGVNITTVINGGDGDDTIKGGRSINILKGGAGDDVITGYRFRDIISGGSGDDFIRGQAGGDVLGGGNGNDTILGTSGRDEIAGGRGNDWLRAGAGEDMVEGEEGNDTLDGADGADVLRGGQGVDLIRGQNGPDTLLGGGNGDSLVGGAGNDLMIGAGGNDTMMGGDGRDLLTGGENRDKLMGGNDDDLLIAGTEFLGVDELAMVQAEWLSDNDYDQRVANIRKGSGVQDTRANGDAFLIGRHRNSFTTVFNDTGYIDSLMGEEGEDWFFVAEEFGDDDIYDREFGERRERI